MKKNDIILIAIIAVLALGLGGYFLLNREESKNAKVVITVNGQLYKEANLYEDQTIEIKEGDHTNVLEIKDGYAKMTSADCTDQICVHQKQIHYNGESIVCLPHLILITIESDEEVSLDSIAN
ncbi:MAG: NusG domain II-containing protein [bacterium]|nr:NusG domain II-containing protein [bacterium]